MKLALIKKHPLSLSREKLLTPQKKLLSYIRLIGKKEENFRQESSKIKAVYTQGGVAGN